MPTWLQHFSSLCCLALDFYFFFATKKSSTKFSIFQKHFFAIQSLAVNLRSLPMCSTITRLCTSLVCSSFSFSFSTPTSASRRAKRRSAIIQCARLCRVQTLSGSRRRDTRPCISALYNWREKKSATRRLFCFSKRRNSTLFSLFSCFVVSERKRR